RYAVFASRWTTTATRLPRSAPSARRARASPFSTGECRATQAIRCSPADASDGSAIRERETSTVTCGSLFAPQPQPVQHVRERGPFDVTLVREADLLHHA